MSLNLRNAMINMSGEEFLVVKQDILSDEQVFAVNFNGNKISFFEEFLDECENKLFLPEKCENLQSLSIQLNNLKWIREKNIVLIFQNMNDFLSWDKKIKYKLLLCFITSIAFWKYENLEKTFTVILVGE